jgi:hypothetical protein
MNFFICVYSCSSAVPLILFPLFCFLFSIHGLKELHVDAERFYMYRG